jgi:hypothetical protein
MSLSAFYQEILKLGSVLMINELLCSNKGTFATITLYSLLSNHVFFVALQHDILISLYSSLKHVHFV